jgi:hypothetical protein
MSEKMRIGGIILLVKTFFIGSLMYFYLVALPGQVACVAVSVFLMFLAFLVVRARTSDFTLLLLGEAVQFLSAGAWFFIAQRSRMSVELIDAVYERTLDFTWDTEILVFLLLGGVFQTILLYFYRNAVRYDLGWTQ